VKTDSQNSMNRIVSLSHHRPDGNTRPHQVDLSDPGGAKSAVKVYYTESFLKGFFRPRARPGAGCRMTNDQGPMTN
jgi:hypothetical protein